MRYACHSLDEILIHPSVLTKRLLYPVSVGYLEQINEDSKKKDWANPPLQSHDISIPKAVIACLGSVGTKLARRLRLRDTSGCV